MISYMGPPCPIFSTFTWKLIDVKPVRNILDASRWILIKVVTEALFKCHHQAFSYATYFVLQRLDIFDRLKLTVVLVSDQVLI